jgi:pilus assembly protein CpaB
MRKGRAFIYLALIILFGLVALAVIYFRFLVPSNTETTTDVQATPVVTTVNIIVLTQKVPRGGALTADVMGMIPIQQELFIPGMFTNISDAESKLAKFDLESGIPLTSGMVVDSAEQLSSTGSNASLIIPRGMVALSIPVDRLSSVSYAPRPGDHVNVIVAMNFVDLDADFQTALPNRNIGVIAPNTGSTTGSAQAASIVAVSGGGGEIVGRVVTDPILAQTFYHVPAEQNQRPRMVSQNLLQDAVVLQVGNFSIKDEPEPESPEAAPTPQPGNAQPTPVPPPPPPDLITLIVTPQDAITLNYLVYSGAKLTLALRPAGDDTRVNTESVTLQFLLEQYNVSVPAKLPTGLQPNILLPQTNFGSYSTAPAPAP